MIRKDTLFKWNTIQKYDFNSIKQGIIQEPSLLYPNYGNEFVLYNFASKKSYASMLSQQNDQNIEVTISFETSALQGAELNYIDVEKQSYEVFKSIKHFRPFLIKFHTKVIVPHPLVRSFLIQKDLGDKRANWVTMLHEYDLEIKPPKNV
jgi:hypothetical protein